MVTWKNLKHIHHRRKALNEFKILNSFNMNETCVLSYMHRNIMAAFVAWKRLFVAERLINKYSQGPKLLDFGAGSGELGFVLGGSMNYSFIEKLKDLTSYVESNVRFSSCKNLESLKEDEFDIISCLDSLEHNISYEAIIDQLIFSLKKTGFLIVSGPTENFIYRLGRKISGFKGDYHVTNIYEIEACLTQKMVPVKKSFVPFGLPLFSISVWAHG